MENNYYEAPASSRKIESWLAATAKPLLTYTIKSDNQIRQSETMAKNKNKVSNDNAGGFGAAAAQHKNHEKPRGRSPKVRQSGGLFADLLTQSIN